MLPLFDQELLIVTDACIRFDFEDWPKRIWVLDASEERNPVMISFFQMPSQEANAFKVARLGPHNIHVNERLPTSWFSSNIIVGTFFSGGVRTYDISDAFRPEEVAYHVPTAPEGCVSIMNNDL